MTTELNTPVARRRSFVLIAVLVITASALLVATSLLFIIDANLAGSAHAADRTQTRLLAWSGVQAVASRLDEQRDRILAGDLPVLDEEYVIYEGGGVVGSIRLLPVTAADELLAPEAGRLDLNSVDAEALVTTGLVEEDLARAIIAHRDGPLGGAFESVAELLQVRGLDLEILYGPLEDIEVADQATGAERDVGERVADRLTGDAPRGLADILTVYSIEPAIQRTGVKRINLNTPWSEELGRRVDRRFGEGSGATLRRIMEGGTSFEADGRICQVLRSFDVDAQQWPDFIDALTTDDGDYHFARLDINTASAEALVTLPGIGEEEAAQIVRARDGLSFEDRSTIVWPLLEEIVAPEAYDRLAGRITTRSWTYRVRLAASERSLAATGGGGDDGVEGDDAAPMIVEAVIDLCDPAPRIAYLREISHLQTAAILARHASFNEDAAVDEEEDAVAQENAEERSRDEDSLGESARAGRDPLEDALDGDSDQGRSPDENRLRDDVFDDEMVAREGTGSVGSSSRTEGTADRALPDGMAASSDPAVESGARKDPGGQPGSGSAGTTRGRRVGRWRAGRS